VRFGALRAPATLFSQLIFWTDFFVLSVLWSGQGAEGAAVTGVYGAVLRAAQSLFLLLTCVSLTFSPFVADLHHRGERGRLDGLYKQVTRWTLAATIPVLLVLLVLPAQVLRIFGTEFVSGASALRIVSLGMIVPVMVGRWASSSSWPGGPGGISSCIWVVRDRPHAGVRARGSGCLGIEGRRSRRPRR
jgi:O-antigen/teichoic acid export membrane protein